MVKHLNKTQYKHINTFHVHVVSYVACTKTMNNTAVKRFLTENLDGLSEKEISMH